MISSNYIVARKQGGEGSFSVSFSTLKELKYQTVGFRLEIGLSEKIRVCLHEKGGSELNTEQSMHWAVSVSEMWVWTLSGPGGFVVTVCDCTGLMCLFGTWYGSHFDQPPAPLIFVFVGKFKELRIDRPFSAFCTARHLKMAMNAGIV